MFGFGITPQGWAPCNGQLLAINQNQALFSLLGTTYGGNGQTTFALPDYRGRVPVHPSYNTQAGGITLTLGAAGGEEAHTLTVNEMPQHNHAVNGTGADATSKSPVGAAWAVPGDKSNIYSTTPDKSMSAAAVSTTGGSQPHSNMQPYLALNFCIAVQGIYPSRN